MSITGKGLKELLRERSYKEGDFVLSSGKKSKYFIDCKPVILSSNGINLIQFAFMEIIDREDIISRVKGIAAVPFGACPIADTIWGAFRFYNQSHMLYVRKEQKDHGTKKRVEGLENFNKGDSVLLIEDVVTTGQSVINAINAIQSEGLVVDSVIALIDRLEGGYEKIRDETGVVLFSVFTREDLANE